MTKRGRKPLQNIRIKDKILSVSGISAITGNSQPYISNVFNRGMMPGLDKAAVIARRLDLTLDELYKFLVTRSPRHIPLPK